MMHSETRAKIKREAIAWAIAIALFVGEGLLAVALWTITTVVALNWIAGWGLDRGDAIGIGLIFAVVTGLTKTCRHEPERAVVGIRSAPTMYRAKVEAERGDA